jgi:hypothetical protein
MQVLIDKKLVDRSQAEKEFATSFTERGRIGITVEKDPLAKAWESARQRGYEKTGDREYVELDDMVDIHRWREKLREDKANYWA